MRGRIEQEKLSMPEAGILANLLQLIYLSDDLFTRFVQTFNETPLKFNFGQFLESLPLAPPDTTSSTSAPPN